MCQKRRGGNCRTAAKFRILVYQRQDKQGVHSNLLSVFVLQKASLYNFVYFRCITVTVGCLVNWPLVSLMFLVKAGETPLFLACIREYEPIVRLLLERYAKADLIPVRK